jgi:hypothetical protein
MDDPWLNPTSPQARRVQAVVSRCASGGQEAVVFAPMTGAMSGKEASLEPSVRSDPFPVRPGEDVAGATAVPSPELPAFTMPFAGGS